MAQTQSIYNGECSYYKLDEDFSVWMGNKENDYNPVKEYLYDCFPNYKSKIDALIDITLHDGRINKFKYFADFLDENLNINQKNKSEIIYNGQRINSQKTDTRKPAQTSMNGNHNSKVPQGKLSFIELCDKISLLEFAINHDYKIDKKKSTRKNPVLVGFNGEKIVLKNVDDNAKMRYFSTDDARDNGNLIEFVKQRIGTVFQADRSKSLYANVNDVLHKYLNIPVSERQTALADFNTEHKSAVQFTRDLYQIQPYDTETNAYLHEARGLKDKTVNHEYFKDKIFTNSWNNNTFTVFPIYDYSASQIIGLNFRDEQVNTNASGSNREEGLWISNPPDKIERIYLVESPIDALSHYQIHHPENALYIANFGGFAPEQYESIINSLAYFKDRFAEGQLPTIAMGFDNDLQGYKYNLQTMNRFSNGDVQVNVVKQGANITIDVSPDLVTRKHQALLMFPEAHMPLFFANHIEGRINAEALEDNRLLLKKDGILNTDAVNNSLSRFQEGINLLNEKLQPFIITDETRSAEGILCATLDNNWRFQMPNNPYLLETFTDAYVQSFKNSCLIEVEVTRAQHKDFNQDIIEQRNEQEKFHSQRLDTKEVWEDPGDDPYSIESVIDKANLNGHEVGEEQGVKFKRH